MANYFEGRHDLPLADVDPFWNCQQHNEIVIHSAGNLLQQTLEIFSKSIIYGILLANSFHLAVKCLNYCSSFKDELWYINKIYLEIGTNPTKECITIIWNIVKILWGFFFQIISRKYLLYCCCCWVYATCHKSWKKKVSTISIVWSLFNNISFLSNTHNNHLIAEMLGCGCSMG